MFFKMNENVVELLKDINHKLDDMGMMLFYFFITYYIIKSSDELKTMWTIITFWGGKLFNSLYQNKKRI